jgi:hypothetical protein
MLLEDPALIPVVLLKPACQGRTFSLVAAQRLNVDVGPGNHTRLLTELLQRMRRLICVAGRRPFGQGAGRIPGCLSGIQEVIQSFPLSVVLQGPTHTVQ